MTIRERVEIGGAAAILLAAALACGSKTKSDAPAEPAPTAEVSASSSAPVSGFGRGPRPVIVEVDEILRDYKANEVRADAKYKGKRVLVIGNVDQIKKDVLDSIYVTMRPPECFGSRPDPRCPFEAVQAFVGDEHAGKAAQLNRVESVGVLCIGNGLMMNVLLKDCEIVTADEIRRAGGASSGTAAPALSVPPKKRR